MITVSEIWKKVKGFEGLYEVSNFGRVKSLPRKVYNGKVYCNKDGRILKQGLSSTGYYNVILYKNNKRYTQKVHRLVAYVFIPLVEGKNLINHIDGNPLNNNVNNLEWCTQKENMQHAVRIGLCKTIELSKEELKRLYIHQNKSVREISKMKNISYNVIVRNLKKYGFKIKNAKEASIKFFITKDFLEKNLKDNTQAELAKKLGCDPSLISKYKKKYKI